MASQVSTPKNQLIFGVATKPAPANTVNGDSYLIKKWNHHILIALIDGLGHGEEAAKASASARNYLTGRFSGELEMLMQELHNQLIDTRGAVVGIARISMAEKKFSFCGTGNIEIKVASDPPIHPVSLEGIVGMSKIRAKKFDYTYRTLSSLALFSDGVSSKFELPSCPELLEPQKLAQEILDKYWNKIDDATVILGLEQNTYG